MVRMLAHLAADDPRWASALPVLRELRPHLTHELLGRVVLEAHHFGRDLS